VGEINTRLRDITRILKQGCLVPSNDQ